MPLLILINRQRLKFTIVVSGCKRKFRFKARTQEERNQWWSEILKHIEENEYSEAKNELITKEAKFWKKWDRINENTFIKEADSGDILLFTGKSVISGITRKITNSGYDHVAMVLTFLEDEEIYFLESTAEGVHVTTWSELKQYKNQLYSKIVWRKLHCERNEDFWEILGTFVNAVEDMEYKITLGKLFTRNSEMPRKSELLNEDRIVDKNRTFFCSELIAKAFKTLGIFISSRSWTTIYPKHFSSKKKLDLTNAMLGEELMIIFNS